MKIYISLILVIPMACHVAHSHPDASKSIKSCQCDPRCDCSTSSGLFLTCTIDAANPIFPRIPDPECYGGLQEVRITSDGPFHIPSRVFAGRRTTDNSFGVEITGNPLSFEADAFWGFNDNSQYPVKISLTNKPPDGCRDEVKFEGLNATLQPSGYHDLNFVNSPALQGLNIDNSYDDMQISWPSHAVLRVLSIHGSSFPKTKTGNVSPIQLNIKNSNSDSPMLNIIPNILSLNFSLVNSILISDTHSPGIITLKFGSMTQLTKVSLDDDDVNRIPSGTFAFPESKLTPTELIFGSSDGNIVIETGSFKNTGNITFSNNGNKIIHSGAFTNTGAISLASHLINEIPSKAFTNTGSIDLSSSRISNLSAGAFVNTGGVDLLNNNIGSIPGGAFNLTKGTINLQQNMIDQILPGSFIPPVGAIKLSKNKIQWIRAGVFDGVSWVELLGNPITDVDPYAFKNGTNLLQMQLGEGAIVSIDAFRLMNGEVFVAMGGQYPVTNATILGSASKNPTRSLVQLSLTCGQDFQGINCPQVDPQICSQLGYYQADPGCYCDEVANLCSSLGEII